MITPLPRAPGHASTPGSSRALGEPVVESDSPESSELASDGEPWDLLDLDLEANDDFLDFRLGDGEAALDLLLDFTLLAGL